MMRSQPFISTSGHQDSFSRMICAVLAYGGIFSTMTAARLSPPFKRTAGRAKKKPATLQVVSDSDSVGNRTPAVPLFPSSTSLESSAARVVLAGVLPQSFFLIDALDLAPRLLGKLLRRDDVVLRITEVEAYRQNDSACHGRFGITPRTAPVFGPGGHAYVYLCYGLHMMLNIVADKEGIGAAVLIRSCAPVSGLKTIQERRGLKTEKPVLLTGPGKVGQALGLSTSWSNHPLHTSGGLEIMDGPEPENILVGPRVGIDYALPADVSAPWRFAIAGTPWICAPKNTLKPRS
ncbi:DNA-3-methyladenine glycosylase [Apostasia shenzhenica]|uniref:DNA-3-methyladenine glycosylase II n=1 Tax=Apostasia shenzhenica TaxID=1088818 RepID=A0A2H9ZUR6_9ASPA|nr:DNA-3-methyladenine glycosylase [Apostasia shenzhenica]